MNAAVDVDKEQMLNKVPQLTIYFWIIKIMATTVGETVADLLSVKLDLGLVVASLVVGVLLLIALVVQLRSHKYVPWIYWVAVVLISVAGTVITDNLVENFGVPLWVTTILHSVLSALARMNVDPWSEAMRMAALPRRTLKGFSSRHSISLSANDPRCRKQRFLLPDWWRFCQMQKKPRPPMNQQPCAIPRSET